MSKRLSELAVEGADQGRGAELMTIKGVSAMTTLALPTLYAMRSRGEGPPSFLIGNRVRYRRGAVEGWIVEQERAEQDRLSRIAG